MAVPAHHVPQAALQGLIGQFLQESNPTQANTYLKNIHELLQKHNLTPNTLSLLELGNLLRSFRVENIADNFGTSCAITGYLLGMHLVSTGADLGNQTYSMLTNIGLMFSFGCAMSFTSSAIDQVHEYRRAHARLKNIQHNQQMTKFMIRSWALEQENSPAEMLKLFQTMAKKQIEALEKQKDTLELLERHAFKRKDMAAVDLIEGELESLRTELTESARENLSMIEEMISESNKIKQGNYDEIKTEFDQDDPELSRHMPEKHKIDAISSMRKNTGIREKNTDLLKVKQATKIEQAIKLKEEINEYKRSIIDVLHRPLHNGKTSYKNAGKNNNYKNTNNYPSTALYKQRIDIIVQLATVYPFTNDQAQAQAQSDTDLMTLFISSEDAKTYQVAEPDASCYQGISQAYAKKREKLDKYAQYPDNQDSTQKREVARRKADLQIHYYHLLDQLKTLNEQIAHHEFKLTGIGSIKIALKKTIQIKNEAPILIAQTGRINHSKNLPSSPNIPDTPLATDDTASHVTQSLLFHTKTPDTQTTFQWRTLKCDLLDYPTTVASGLNLGIEQYLSPDHKKYQYLTQIKGVRPWSWRVWGYHVKNLRLKMGRFKSILTPFILFSSLPYFLYYGLKNFGNLLDNLQKVVDALHKSVRDVDQALDHREGDSILVSIFIRFPLKLAWAAIVFVPETLGGLAYWMLSAVATLFLKSNNNIAQTARAIAPDFMADYIEDVYNRPNRTRFRVFGLYVLTFFGGVLNIVLTPIRKIVLPILSILIAITNKFIGIFTKKHRIPAVVNKNNIQHSRNQLNTGLRLIWLKIKSGFMHLFAAPFMSLLKQSKEMWELVDARYPHHFLQSPVSFAIALLKKAWICLKFLFCFLLNVLFLGTLKVGINIAKTAPAITATVITCSTLFAGITLPFIGTIAVTGSAQMKLGIAALCGDFTNGSHDIYNLSSIILRKNHLKTIEYAALSKMTGVSNLILFNQWKEIYERVEEGKVFIANMHKKEKSGEQSYTQFHISTTKKALEDLNVKNIIASHLAYFLINTADRGHPGRTHDILKQQYEKLFVQFQKNTLLDQMVSSVTSNPKYMQLSDEEKSHYLLSMAAHIGHDYSRALVAQVYEHYIEKQKTPTMHPYTLCIVNTNGTTFNGQRDSQNPDVFLFENNIQARKLSLWEKFLYLFIPKPENVIGEYALSATDLSQSCTFPQKQTTYFAWMSTLHAVDLNAGLVEVAKQCTPVAREPVAATCTNNRLSFTEPDTSSRSASNASNVSNGSDYSHYTATSSNSFP